MSTYALVFLALLVMATGSGLFKPIISGTIARTTDERTSAFGFGIYYWMINLGAFLAPLVVSVLKGFSWQLRVHRVGRLLRGHAAAHDLRLPRAARPREHQDAQGGAGWRRRGAGRRRFMLMIVVYSGFWILYFQNFGSVLWYLRDFVDREPVSRRVTSLLHAVGLPWTFTFDAEHVTVINAGTIILLQVLVSRIVANRKALPTMVTGMVIGALGFVCWPRRSTPGCSSLGIAVFSIGEMTAHPKYYSFIGLVAPPDRKAVYMGYAFLYGVFGSLLGSNLGRVPVRAPHEAGHRHAGRPPSTRALFWLVFAVLDVFAALGLIVFARRFGEDTPAARSGARLIMYVVYALVLALGGLFLWVAFSPETPQYRTAVQAVIFVALGAGGLLMNYRR